MTLKIFAPCEVVSMPVGGSRAECRVRRTLGEPVGESSQSATVQVEKPYVAGSRPVWVFTDPLRDSRITMVHAFHHRQVSSFAYVAGRYEHRKAAQ